jgi:DNA-binding LacI/PurR family transcriptional regulator
MIERPLPVPGAHAVVIDHRRGIYDLTCMLVEQGIIISPMLAAISHYQAVISSNGNACGVSGRHD